MAKKPTKTTSLRNSRGDESRREPVSDDRTPREECKQRRTKEPRLSPRREGHSDFTARRPLASVTRRVPEVS